MLANASYCIDDVLNRHVRLDLSSNCAFEETYFYDGKRKLFYLYSDIIWIYKKPRLYGILSGKSDVVVFK